MGQCIKYKRPSRPLNSMGYNNRSINRDNFNRIVKVDGTGYLATDKNFIPKDLITAVDNPNYIETKNSDELPPYNYKNPFNIQNENSKTEDKINNNNNLVANQVENMINVSNDVISASSSRKYSETTSF